MAASTMDNASAQLAIAMQLRDLNELEASGTVDKVVVRLQREQLEIDSGFDAITFEASRRLAISMAKAVEDDAASLRRSMPLPQIDDATFDRLAQLNRPPPKASNLIEPAPQSNNTYQTLPSKAESRKRIRSLTPENEPLSASVNSEGADLLCSSRAALDDDENPHKKVKREQITRVQNSGNQVENSGMSSVSQASTTDLRGAQMMRETAASTTAIQTSPTTAACASCSDQFSVDKLVKTSCEHYYCKDCFGHFIESSIQTHDAFPPNCCKIPIAFVTVADNVSAVVFSNYSARQAEIKNTTAIYCGVQGCGVKIEKDRINELSKRATCVACRRDTCIQCRGEFPPKVNGKQVGHVCKKDKALEEVLTLAKNKGWQTCYQCGNMIALNFGCHHMRCRCDAQFCYRCGTKWRNCDCGDYDEPQLQTRATRGMALRAARRADRGLPPDLRPREQQLAELRQRLRVDCDHNNFSYERRSRMDPGYCEICGYQGWIYIFRCDHCRFTACRDCHNSHGRNGGGNPGEEFIFGNRNHDDDTDEEDKESVSEDESI